MVEGFKTTDAGIIPNDWNDVALGKYAKLINGRTYALHEWELQGTPVIRQQNLTGRAYIFYYSNLKLPDRQYCKNGDLLFMWSATFGPVIWRGEKAIFHYHIWKIETDEDNLDSSFLYHILEELTERLKKYSTNGGTMLHLTKGGMEVMPIPLPPSKSEQTAIATALNDAETLIKQLEQLLAKKRNIKTGAMQELLKAKDGWEEKKLGEVARFRRGSFPQPYGLDKWYDETNGFPFVQVFDVDDNMKLKPDTKRHISVDAQNMSVFVEKGSIVLTIQGSIGRIAMTQYDAYIDRTLLLFESYIVPFNKYFFMLLLHVLFEQEKQRAPGGTIKTITKVALSSFKISYPKIAEQNKIAEILSDMESEIQQLDIKIEKYKMLKQGMMQSLLTGKIRLL